MLSILDLLFFPIVCILDMLLCTASFWFFFTISYALDTIFGHNFKYLTDFPEFFLLIHLLCIVASFFLPQFCLVLLLDFIASHLHLLLAILLSILIFLLFFFNLHIYTFKQKNTITRYVNINVPVIQVKKA